VLGGAVAWAVVVASRHALGSGHSGSITGLVLGGLAGLAVMAVVAWRMRIPDVQDVLAMVRR
jgi:putative peptidoglycan lipid II flippase